MIPESSGATPYGIFLLADSYCEATKLLAASNRLHSGGPVRLLGYQAAELFLKTYMRSAGETIAALRAHNHDLLSMVERATVLGLRLPPRIADQARKMVGKADYIRARYVVTEERSDISTPSLLRFVETIRAGVVAALDLDENGSPRSKHWLGDLPSDYPVQHSRAVDP